MQPILPQIQAIIRQHVTDKFSPQTETMTDASRLTLLRAILPMCEQIPHPASGNTLQRWQILAYVASVDLTLVKWLESHLDALSILQELGHAELYQQHPNKLWAVWAAEGQAIPVSFSASATSSVSNSPDTKHEQGVCNGTKTWCSGANLVDFGLMTYRDEQQQSQLIVIDMAQNTESIAIDNSAWQAVGMQATNTATLSFQQTPAIHILPQIMPHTDKANTYLERAGFWHGAGGVAACWYGASVAIAEYLMQSCQHKPHAFKAMYLGQISTQLAVTQQYFYQVAEQINHEPTASHELSIRQLRQQVEVTARMVIEQVGLALGATPFCQNAHFARLCADLGVFIRQSHGAFDAQAIGELVTKNDNPQAHLWQL